MDMFKIFRKPTAVELLLEELEESYRNLQVADRQREYTSRMVDFYKSRIRCLNQQLSAHQEEKKHVEPPATDPGYQAR